MIPFNRPILPSQAVVYMTEAFQSGKVSGDGAFSRRCEAFFQGRYGMPRCLLTTSCTDALELAALLLQVGPGDEVIVPSFTFVSTANAFAIRGAKLVFADSLPDHPNLDVSQLEALITPRTKVIVPVHYAGVAVDMAPLLALARLHGVAVVEDAAQAVEAGYRGQPLGTLGDIGTFSFHETKNIHCGEGGAIAVNRPDLVARSEILREKGTNRAAFFRGEVDKYGWMDVGSSFLPSDILAAILWAQLEQLDAICQHRLALWGRYHQALAPLESRGLLQRPTVAEFARHNAHAYYLVLPDEPTRARFIAHLKGRGVMAVFHYQSLHASPYFRDRHDGRPLPQADRYSDCLVRLPLFHDLDEGMQGQVIDAALSFFGVAQ